MRISEDSVASGKRYIALLVTVLLVLRCLRRPGGQVVREHGWLGPVRLLLDRQQRPRRPGGRSTGSRSAGLGTDTGLSGDDQCTGAIDIGFPFDFYGDSYSYAYIETNGLLSFDGYTYGLLQRPDTVLVSPPDLLVAPFWDDLAVGSYYNSGVGLL